MCSRPFATAALLVPLRGQDRGPALAEVRKNRSLEGRMTGRHTRPEALGRGMWLSMQTVPS